MSKELLEKRKLLEDDFWMFVTVIMPQRYFGDLHREMCEFLTNPEGKRDKLVLVPRDHQKSVIAALYVVWRITKDPCIRVAYITSTFSLAEKQVGFMQNIFLSERYRTIWPEMLEWDQKGGKWEPNTHKQRWTRTEFEVAHPDRKKANIPESTVTTSSVGSSKTGFHFDLLIMDDMVDEKNYRTETGREDVRLTYSAFSSIASQNAETVAVGTRYHGDDLYGGVLMQETIEEFDETGEFLGEEKTFDVFLRQVEDEGDMTGNFIWPRKQVEDGQWFGWDTKTLAHKKGKYKSAGSIDQFFSQYYNNPNAADLQVRHRDMFQYFNPKFLKRDMGNWQYKGKELRTFCAMDLAFSKSKKADYTALVVLGLDHEGYIYVLDLDRFKTDSRQEDYYRAVIAMQEKWQFHKIRIETNAGGKFVVNYLKDRFRQEGITCSIDSKHENKRDETKEQRIESIVMPHYDNGNIFHTPGGYIGLLEEEIILPKPPHDDLKDALAGCMEIAKKPIGGATKNVIPVRFNKRFGGIIR